MQTLTSRPIELKKDIKTIYGMISNPASLNPLLERFSDKIPAKKVVLHEDEVQVDTGALGEIVMKRSHVMVPNLIEYSSEKSPVPVKLSINLTEEGVDKTLAQFTISLSVPAFLSGMVKSKVEPIMAEVANTLEKIDFSRLLK